MSSGPLSEPIHDPEAPLATKEPQFEIQRPTPDDLTGKVAVVTGGGWNIGRAIALAIARAGARVVVASRNLTNLEETVAIGRAEDLKIRPLAGDLTDPAEVDRVFEDVVANEGGVDVLACLAGGYGAPQPLHETDPQAWLDVLVRNVYTTFLCCRAVLQGMLQKRAGDILTCAGGGAFFPMVDVHATAYACSKAAICRFTDQLYAEHRNVAGLRINCIEPGMTLSPLDLSRIEEEEKRTGQVNPARERNHAPEDAAELVLWLLSPAARGINGRILSTDEDWWRDGTKVAQVVPSDLYRLRRTFLPE